MMLGFRMLANLPSVRVRNRFKSRCLACDESGRKMNKEHYWPKWLIARTGASATGVRWVHGKIVNPYAATVPLCLRCNSELGRDLEGPVSAAFAELDAGEGLSDSGAEILVRWMWKFEGIGWMLSHPGHTYSDDMTLRERVLQPITALRGRLTLALSRIRAISPRSRDEPLGIDSQNLLNTVFVSGVFSKLAIMVLIRDFESLVPANYSLYRLAPRTGSILDRSRLFYPKFGFENDIEAVIVTHAASARIAKAHDELIRDSDE